MTYQELRQAIADYMHRSDLTTLIPGFIEYARERINRDLRVREMLVSAPLTLATNPSPLPADFLEMRDIYHTVGTRRITLTLVGRKQLNDYANGNQPLFYSIDGLQLETAPGGEGVDFNLIYYGQQPPLVADTDTNATLARFSTIWLYGALVEAHNYTQDMEMRQSALATYTSEVQQANAQAASSEAGSSLQIQGASQWV